MPTQIDSRAAIYSDGVESRGEEREEEDRKLGEKREALYQIHNDLITTKEGLNRGFWARVFSSR
ncbi:hypothetical protein RHGRI_030208 [Rhododendron griersonianum]|uniref:Uncharacterized protein n=1 Tax=Rhododendron griersonianum TaxID=479676 RepID=A0AAV6IMQ6_9ERIC|nr:hypothetical protein RHGRI_030208 [Rhododendron griersonianum]